MTDEDVCGVCLDQIDLRKPVFICKSCCKGVHLSCWQKWTQKCGRCIYCNEQIIDKKTDIVPPDYGMSFTLDDVYDSSEYDSSDDSDYEPVYNFRSRYLHSFPTLRSRIDS